ncbi:hypothetical protein RI367_000322 [Sorochytrium milnesiophthora]
MSHIPLTVLEDVPRVDEESDNEGRATSRRKSRASDLSSHMSSRNLKKKSSAKGGLELLSSELDPEAYYPASSRAGASKKRGARRGAGDKDEDGDVLESSTTSSQLQASRKEVVGLRDRMRTLLGDLGRESEGKDYPTEINALVRIAQEEQLIFDGVLQEIVRQVTINMIERGEILAEVRRRYNYMFNQIPKIVKTMHAELIAHRKVNKRLSKEILRARNTIFALSQQLEQVKRANDAVEQQGPKSRQRLLDILARTENVDEIMKEYHKLYRMQRKRLEDSIKSVDREKRVWVDAATNLALRIGTEHGLPDVTVLQKFEYGRVRAANHMISIIGQYYRDESATLERKSEEWKDKVTLVANAIEEEDNKCQTIVSRLSRELRTMHRSIDLDDRDELELYPGAKLVDEMSGLIEYDARTIQQALLRWVQQVGEIADRYTSERDEPYIHEIQVIRRLTDVWFNMGLTLMRKNEKNTTGRDYAEHEKTLKDLMNTVETVIRKMKTRLTGGEGIAGQAIGLQNQLEDKYTSLSGRDNTKPLNLTEKKLMADALVNWSSQLEQLSNVYTSSIRPDREKVTMGTESWLARVQDQISTDGELRAEDNVRLHNNMISWMVKLLIKTGKQAPDASWDTDFAHICKEVAMFNESLMQDSSDIEMLSDDRKELRAVNKSYTESWLMVAKRLLEAEKISGIKRMAASNAKPPTIVLSASGNNSRLGTANGPDAKKPADDEVIFFTSDLLSEGLNGKGVYHDSSVPEQPPEQTWASNLQSPSSGGGGGSGTSRAPTTPSRSVTPSVPNTTSTPATPATPTSRSFSSRP